MFRYSMGRTRLFLILLLWECMLVCLRAERKRAQCSLMKSIHHDAFFCHREQMQIALSTAKCSPPLLLEVMLRETNSKVFAPLPLDFLRVLWCVRAAVRRRTVPGGDFIDLMIEGVAWRRRRMRWMGSKSRGLQETQSTTRIETNYEKYREARKKVEYCSLGSWTGMLSPAILVLF